MGERRPFNSCSSLPEVAQSLHAFQPKTDPLNEERAIFLTEAAPYQDPQQRFQLMMII